MGGILEYLREFHFASVVLRLLLAMIIGGCISWSADENGVPPDSAHICWFVSVPH